MQRLAHPRARALARGQTTTEGDLPGLRRRLIAMRQELVDELCGGIDGGAMALLGSINGALAAVEAQLLIEADPAERVVVADDGDAIRLQAYTGADRVAAVELSPVRAVALAGELLRAALPRL